MRLLAVITALVPLPGLAAELWCMPSTICRADGSCHPTDDQESSIRLQDMDAATSSLRSNAQDVAMTRRQTGEFVEWRGVNQSGDAEYLLWRRADMVYNHTIALRDGGTFKAVGHCEIQ